MTRQGIAAPITAVVSLASFAFCSTGSAAAVQLQLKLPKGKTYYQKSTFDQRITQTVMGQDQVIEQGIGTGLKWDVLDVDRQGNMRIRHTFIWCASKQVNPMGTVEYDSAKNTTPAPGAETFAALLGQSYLIRVTPKGQVLDVNGIEELREAVRKKVPGGADESVATSPVALFLDQKNVKEMTAANLSIYPDKPVEMGESWSKKQTLTLGFGIITESKWTWQKREGGLAVIALTASVRSDPGAPPMDMGGMKMRFDLAGTQESELRVEEATGLILADQTRQQLKGEIKVGESAEGAPMMTIPSVFDTTSKVEMSDKPWLPAANTPGKK